VEVRSPRRSPPALFGGAVLCWARAQRVRREYIHEIRPGRTRRCRWRFAALEAIDAASACQLQLLITFILLVVFRRWLRPRPMAPGAADSA
jgi:hypothetical protein